MLNICFPPTKLDNLCWTLIGRRWEEKGEMGLKGQYDKGNKIGCEILKAGGQQI